MAGFAVAAAPILMAGFGVAAALIVMVDFSVVVAPIVMAGLVPAIPARPVLRGWPGRARP